MYMPVTFPLGAAAGVSMELHNLTSMANAAACCIVGKDYGGVQLLKQMLGHSGIPPDLHVQAVEQLATGAGMAYPNLLSPTKVLSVLKEIENGGAGRRTDRHRSSVIQWGSSLDAPATLPKEPISEELRARCKEMFHAWNESPKVEKLIEGLSIESLFQALHDPDAEVYLGSSLGLASMGRPAVKPLIEALCDSEAQIRKCAALALGRNLKGYKDPEVIEALLPVLQDPSGEVRANAAWALVGSEDMRVAEEYIRLLRDPNSQVRELALRGLGDIAKSHLYGEIYQKAVDPILLALKDLDWQVRCSAVRALRSFRHIEGLLTALAYPLDYQGLSSSLWMWTRELGSRDIEPLTDVLVRRNEYEVRYKVKDKAIKILAKTLYRELREQGHEPRELVALSVEFSALAAREFIVLQPVPGSTPEQALKLLAKTVYGAMKTQGHRPEEFVILGSEILELIAQELGMVSY